MARQRARSGGRSFAMHVIRRAAQQPARGNYLWVRTGFGARKF